jgi:hypothetical protein
MTIESWPAHQAQVGQLDIRRALPLRQKRMVGAWCFLDRYGPLSFTSGRPMDVAPHPHIGIQTVSWLLEGEVLHRDSLGYEALVTPGGVNVMTSGRGISHSEETPRGSSGRLSGVQLWVALPDESRHQSPSFEHHASLPVVDFDGGTATIIMGALAGHQSDASSFSAILGADLRPGAREMTLPLDATFEHALFVLDGAATLEGEELAPDILYYLPPNRRDLALTGSEGTRILLLGGTPFGEPVLMWWNFVARTHEEIAAAREEWEKGTAFGEVRGYDGPALAAPPLRARARPPAAS